ncbi:MAG TPA: hypothetical protein VNL98_06785, partial [Gemmatimonadales bacterium]|nr:hypothetical protein [Gemmatimonadales bacterium]
MSPYFPEPRPQPPEHVPYWCPRCQAWYRVRRGMEGVSCAVAHSPGGCCHYNEERVEIHVALSDSEWVQLVGFAKEVLDSARNGG